MKNNGRMVLWGKKDAINCSSMEYVLLFERKKKNNPRARSIFPLDCVVMKNRKQVGACVLYDFSTLSSSSLRNEPRLCLNSQPDLTLHRLELPSTRNAAISKQGRTRPASNKKLIAKPQTRQSEG